MTKKLLQKMLFNGKAVINQIFLAIPLIAQWQTDNFRR